MAIKINDNYTNRNHDAAGVENMTKFASYFDNRYFDPFIKGYGFVFVTRPSLFIYPVKETSINDSSGVSSLRKLAYNNMCRDPLFAQYTFTEAKTANDKLIAEQLSFQKEFSDGNYIQTNFLPMFTNQLKSFDPQDLNMEMVDAFETKQGYRMPMPTFTTASEGSGNLTFNVLESSNLDITKMLTLWIKYISNITDGTFSANPDFVRSRILDYMCSVYYFCLEPDGKTIKYWSKYTGCWPNSVPLSSLGYNLGTYESPELSVSFAYTSKEDMTPAILEDFNRVALDMQENADIYSTTEDYAPIHNSEYLNEDKVKELYHKVNGTSGTVPFIISKKSGIGTNADLMNGKFELVFPIDVKNLYTTSKFSDTDIYNNLDGQSIFTSNFAPDENK